MQCPPAPPPPPPIDCAGQGGAQTLVAVYSVKIAFVASGAVEDYDDSKKDAILAASAQTIAETPGAVDIVEASTYSMPRTVSHARPCTSVWKPRPQPRKRPAAPTS